LTTTPDRVPARPLALGLCALLALAAAVPGAATAQDDPDANACDRGWFDVELREDIAPEGVIATAVDELWVAGGSMLGGGRRQAAVLHREADEATLEFPPPPSTRDSGLMAIAVAGPDEPIWAVGYGREVDYVAGFATRRNGDNWDLSETIRPEDANATLTDVTASLTHGVWAAGFLQGPPGEQRPWVLERRSGDWLASEPPLAGAERATLAGVSVATDGRVWVAGTAFVDAAMRPYLAVREGDTWSRIEVEGLEQAALADLDMTEDGMGWAVGHRLAGATIEPLLLHWDGTTWNEAPAPDTGDVPTLLTSVSSANGVLSVGGTSWDPEKRRYAALAARLVEGEWVISSSRRGWGMGTVTDISGDPGSSGWVVGRTDSGLIARVCAAPLADVAPAELPPTSGAPEAVAVEPPRPTPLTGDVVVRDVAEAAGLPTTSQTWGSVAADFDGDGRDDIFFGRHGARARLFLNEGGTYVDTERKFGGGDRHACAASDVDDSGLPDLYCAFGASRGTGTKSNQLWLDPGRATPLLEPWAGGATEPLGRGRQPRFLDIDEDGDEDLFLGQETKRMDGQPSANRAFLRTGVARFEATAVPGIDTGLAAEAIDIADYDGDGRDDILFVYYDLRAREPRSGVRLYRNEPGLAFSDVSAETGIASIGERDAELVDLDGDGQLDLVQLAEDSIVISLAREGRFERAADRGVAEGTALASGDADGDGDVDLYVLQGKSESGARDIILLNDGDGTSFTRLDVPEVKGGSEDDVIALDYDGDGRTDFLALNGRNSERGPVQLITLGPA
jgi:hypothetical protein